MAKGAVLDEAFVNAIGLGDQLLTLTHGVQNKHHDELQEPMFHIRTKEIEEVIYLDRKYVFDNQISIRSHYGRGDKVLVWMQRSLHRSPHAANTEMVQVLMAREFFIMGDWKEFQRFRQFVKSQRILDAQARQWISDNHPQFRDLAKTADGVQRVIDCLGAIAEWPDLEGQTQEQSRTTLELVAKSYSASLAHVRASPLLPATLLRCAPDKRLNIFRLLSLVEDPEGGARSLLRFLGDLGKASEDVRVTQLTVGLKTSQDIARAFTALRLFLLSRKMVGNVSGEQAPAPAV